MEIESSGALRVAAGSRISQVSLLSFSRTDQHKPRSLSLMSTAQILVSMSRHKPEKVGDHDTHWYAKVGTKVYIFDRVLTSSGNHGKPVKSLKKVPCMEKSWTLKKPEMIMEKLWNFVK